MEAAASEQRMKTFQAVKDALNELRDLQLRKAELERGTTPMQRKEAVQMEIEHVLDRIDDTREN